MATGCHANQLQSQLPKGPGAKGHHCRIVWELVFGMPDSSLPVKVTLFFPALDEGVELAMPSIIKGPTAQDLFYRIFYDCDRVVSRMREEGDVDLARLSELEDRLDDVKDHFDAASDDRGATDQTLHRLRELYREVWHLSR